MNEHHAILQTNGDAVFGPIEEIAKKNGFSVVRDETKMVVDAPLGSVILKKNGHRTLVEFGAPTKAELQALKELYAERFERLGFSAGILWKAPDAVIPLNQVICHVEARSKISTNFMRIRLRGDFSDFATPTAGLHFRFLFGPDGAPWPTLDENGLTHWPGGIAKWHRPPYTVRRLGRSADWMDVDIVLHPGGRVTEWCERVRTGDEIALTGPSGSKMPKGSDLALFGDETALPVILRIIEDAPEDMSGSATVAVRDLDDIQRVADPDRFELRWVDMNDPESLLRALKKCLKDAPEQSIFFAAERQQADAARVLFKDVGKPSSGYRAASYWTKAP